MTSPQRNVQEWIQASRTVVREALARSHASQAWQLLLERDADGNVQGHRPYTDAALAEFTAAYQHDPDDLRNVHHLAIAHHARAWDMELQNDPRAVGEWERALEYWRVIANAAEFWAGLKDKFLRCSPDADPAWLAEVRKNLLDDLLDIHVDWVRHYCETGEVQRAIQHVEIVKRARLPLASRKRLVDKVFKAMTSAVPEAKASHAYDSALGSVERFLALFPDHVPALRMQAEIVWAWLGSLSYKDDWDAIVQLTGRTEPWARRLAHALAETKDPLARSALEELAFEFALRGYDRGSSYLASQENVRQVSLANRDAAQSGFELGLRWGQLASEYATGGTRLKELLAACLSGYAACLYGEVCDVMEADLDMATQLDTAIDLYRRIIQATEEAVSYAPDEEHLIANLAAFRSNLSELELQKQLGHGWQNDLRALFGLDGDSL